MYEFLHVLLEVLLFLLVFKILENIKKRVDQPYSWKCPHQACGFSCRTNQKSVLPKIIQSHENTHRWDE